MTKHRLRESINSLFRSHIDPEKDEQLRGTKDDIDSKVEKILKLIKEEDQDETDGIPVGNLKKEPLVELIEDFHKQYHSLYALYDHLTGELRKKVNSKPETASSSSSESESENPSKRKGNKNGKVDGDFQKVMENIKQELETASLEIADLKRKLTATTEENQALESKLQETETIIKDVKIGFERLEDEKSKLLVENEDLNLKLGTASKVEAELNLKLEDITRERDNLIMEKETATRRIEEGEKIMGDLRATADQITDEREAIKLELEAAKQDLESARQEVIDLSLTQETTKEENNSLTARNNEISDEIKQAQNMIQELKAESDQLKEKLEARETELYSLTEMHHVHENEALGQIKGLEAQVTEMEAKIENAATEAKLREEENLGLKDRMLQLELISKVKVEEMAMLLKKIEDNEDISSSKIEELRAQVNNLQLEVDRLHIQKGELEEQMVHKGNEAAAQVKDLVDRINLLQEESDSLHSQRSQSEIHVETKTREISEHLIQIEILKQDLASHTADQQRLLEEREDFKAQVKGLEEEFDCLSKQKSELEEQLRSKDNEINQLSKERERMQAKIFEVEKTRTEQGDELSALQKKYEDGESETSVRIITLTEQVSNTQAEVNSLQAQKGELEELLACKNNEASDQIRGLMDQVHAMEQQLELLQSQNNISESELMRRTQESSEYMILIKNLKQVIASKTSDHQIVLEHKEGLTVKVKDLEVELESLHRQKSELEEQIRTMNNETIQLREEKEGMQGKILEMEDTLIEKSNELFALQKKHDHEAKEASAQIMAMAEQINDLQQEITSKTSDHQIILEHKEGLTVKVKDLEVEFEFLHSHKSGLEEQIRTMNNETIQLREEKEGMQGKILEMENTLIEKSNGLFALQKKHDHEGKEASAQIMALAEQINDLQQEIASKTSDHRIVLEHKEGLTVKVKDLEVEFESLHSQKSELEEQIRTMNNETIQLREEKEGKQGKILEMENTLIEKSNELFALQKKHDHEGKEASAQIMALAEQIKELQQEITSKTSDHHIVLEHREGLVERINDLQQELNSLHTQKSQLELQIEKQKQESSENLAQAANQSIELTSKIEALERKLKEQEGAFDKLTDEYKQVQNWFQECKENLQFTERTLEEKAEGFRKIVDSKDQMLADLERMVEDLKGDLEVKADELSTLVENVRNIEVKLRLSNQKLRVTEQLLSEKEEIHKTAEEKIATLSAIIASNSKAHFKIITDLSEKVNDAMAGLESVVKKFEEDYGNYENSVSEVMVELQIAKNWVVTMNLEKEQLKKEVCILVEQLKEKKDCESVLREKLGKLELKASKEEAEKEKLAEAVSQFERKIGEYEGILKDKDEGMLSLGEEKREAIRQLCLWIDYHRSRYDYLKELLSKMLPVRTRRGN